MAQAHGFVLDELCQLYALYASRMLQRNGQPLLAHMRYYSNWLVSESRMTNMVAAGRLDDYDVFDRARDIVVSLAESPAAAVAKTILKAMSCFPALASGQISSLDLLLDEGSLFDIGRYRWAREGFPVDLMPDPTNDDGRCGEDQRTQVLDLGLVPNYDALLMDEERFPTPSRAKSCTYTFAARYEPILQAARQRMLGSLAGHENGTRLEKHLRYILLDIGRDLSQQYWQGNQLPQKFDVVITTEYVLYQTADVHSSLRLIHSLLQDNGVLMLQVGGASLGRWPLCIFGILPHEGEGAFRGQTGLRDWNTELSGAGFNLETVRHSSGMEGDSWAVARLARH